MRSKAIGAGADDIVVIVIDENRLAGFQPKAPQRKRIDIRVWLDHFLDARDDNISEMVEYGLRRAEHLPKFRAKIGNGKQRDGARGQFVHDFKRARDRARNRLVKTRPVGVDLILVFRI